LDYALIADGERGALIDPRGNLAWMCAPSWDSPAVFSSLLGGGGLYAVTPRDDRYVWGGHYEERTLIWNDRWVTTDGVIECREALAFPGDPRTAVLLRQIRAVDGPARVRAILDVQADFGRHDMREIRSRNGSWTAHSGGLWIRWTCGSGVRRDRRGALALDLDLPEGASHDLVLEISSAQLGDHPPRPDDAWVATEHAWHREVPDMGETLAPRDARHSYAVMRGLTASTGAMVAAATMALPERAEAGRNYDYRYAWVRDQCFAGQAAAVLEPLPLLDGAVTFIAERILADGAQLKPAYRADGGPVPDEGEVTHLRGYPGAKVKTGNWVNHQFQLDVFGECLLLFSTAASFDRLDTDHWAAVGEMVGAIRRKWTEPDAGIWELDNQRWAHSRLTCVAGLRAVAGHATPAQAAEWSSLADAVMADVAKDCVHPAGRWQRGPADPRVDASLLLPAIRGAVAADDPRTLATLAAVEDDLCEEGYIYRFRHDERPLKDAEGAFSFCGFTMALALHQQGREREGIGWFERTRGSCGPPGLLTEEFDVGERQLRGNLPQAFVHALLLESAGRLVRPGDRW
jgi:hypothetical protein